MRVLIADDSGVVRERLVERLNEIKGIEIVGQAKDGLEARELFQELKPDTVILDLRMPWRNGLDVLRDIKSGDLDVTVIILTNYPYPQYRKMCQEEGVDYFFDKSSSNTSQSICPIFASSSWPSAASATTVTSGSSSSIRDNPARKMV